MIIKTLEYYPEHIKQMKEYIRLSVGIDSELYKVWENIETIMKNHYVDTMDEATILKWENILGIVASPLDDLDDRRRRIKGYFASDLPYTEKKLNEILAAMCGKDGYELVINRTVGTVEINIKLNSVRLIDNAKEVIRAAVPCDMVVTARIIYNIYASFEGMTYEQMEAYTYDQLRNDPQFQKNIMEVI